MNDEKLKILKSNAIEAYEAGTEDNKLLLEKLWPDVFSKPETDPYILACLKLGKNPIPRLTDRSDADKVSSDAYDRLIICIRAKNMINGKVWKPVYGNGESHYFPRWLPDPSGFGFSGAAYVIWCASTNVGSRLEYRSYDLMIEGVTEFKELYNDYLTMPDFE